MTEKTEFQKRISKLSEAGVNMPLYFYVKDKAIDSIIEEEIETIKEKSDLIDQLRRIKEIVNQGEEE